MSNSESLIAQLDNFSKLSLADLDAVKFQNSCDTKFTFHRSKLASFLESIKDSYSVLSIDNKVLMDYESLYYDTPDFDLYLRHHNKRRNRFKLRYRKYVVSDLTFFEIKVKNNKGRTVKRRVTVSDIEQKGISGRAETHYQNESAKSQILNEALENLQASLWVNFSRITLADKDFNERATIDVNLHYKMGDKKIVCADLVIAELKQEAFSRTSGFMRALNDLHINPLRISKYCFGMKKMYPHLKHNNFKPKFSKIDRLSA